MSEDDWDIDKEIAETYEYYKQYIDHPKQEQIEGLFEDAVKREEERIKDGEDTVIRCHATLSGIYKAYNEWRKKKGLEPK